MNMGRVRIGRNGSHPPTSPADDAAALRVVVARSCGAWRELDPGQLVQRPRGFYVDPESDECFRVYRGTAISAGGAVISDQTPLAFIVDGDHVTFLEKQPRKWSEFVYERERAGAR